MAKKDKERGPLSAIARERLARWLQNCERDHATPLVLVAVSHDADEHRGDVHVYRTEDGPTDAALGALLQAVALQMGGPRV